MTKEQKKSLTETHPEIAKEADGWDPETVPSTSYKKLAWVCTFGHKYQAVVANRTRLGSGCPLCSRYSSKVWVGRNDLATTHPEIASEAHMWDPKTVRYGSIKKLEWKCVVGHIWLQSPNQRTAKKILGCPYCSNRKVLPGFNDLATTHPELALEAEEWDPKSLTSGSSRKMLWKCSLDHKWIASVSSRSRGSGCKICANQAIQKSFNDLKTLNPQLALEADGWDPSTIGAGSGKRLDWKCPLGHQWKATVESRHSRKLGCPYCTNQRVLTGFNDLATTHPLIANQAVGWDPTQVNAGSHVKKTWRCELDHLYLATVAHRTRNDSGCPTCAGRRVLVGFNDLATTHPALANQASGWDPREITAGSGTRLQWKCELGHLWYARPSLRSALNRGCPSCSKTGFDPNEDGYLYFLRHPEWELLQIGISNKLKNRLNTHSNLGWEVVEVRGPTEGYLVQRWETAILRHIRTNGGKMADTIGIDPFDGYSESWLEESFTIGSLREIMDAIDQEDRKP